MLRSLPKRRRHLVGTVHLAVMSLRERTRPLGWGSLNLALPKMTLPSTRPLRETLLLGALVVATMFLAAVVFWAVTSWLWASRS